MTSLLTSTAASRIRDTVRKLPNLISPKHFANKKSLFPCKFFVPLYTFQPTVYWLRLWVRSELGSSLTRVLYSSLHCLFFVEGSTRRFSKLKLIDETRGVSRNLWPRFDRIFVLLSGAYGAYFSVQETASTLSHIFRDIPLVG